MHETYRERAPGTGRKRWRAARVFASLFVAGAVLHMLLLPGIALERNESDREIREENNFEEEVPGVSEEAPGISEEVPGVSEEAPGISEEAPGISEEAPGISEEVSGVSEVVPVVSDELSGISDEISGISEEGSAVSDEAFGDASEAMPPGVSDALTEELQENEQTAGELAETDAGEQDADALPPEAGVPVLYEGICGGCRWSIDEQGLLLIEPATEGTKAQLDALGNSASYWRQHASQIRSVRIAENVYASPGTGGLGWMLANCTHLERVDLSELHTENAKTMRAMFYNCPALTEITGLGAYSTKNVANLMGMFYGCSALQEVLFGDQWTTAKVTTMENLFRGCTALCRLDVERFNTGKVTSMANMFSGCAALTDLDLSSFNTSRVTTMEGMFSECRSLNSLNVSGFDTSRVTTMANMFNECGAVETFDLSSFSTPSLTNVTRMFFNSGSAAATKLYLNQFDLMNVPEDRHAHFLQQLDNVTDVIIGEHFVYDSRIQDGFLRGVWVVDENWNGKEDPEETGVWTAEQIALRLMDADGRADFEDAGFGMPMRFLRTTEHAMQADFPVTYYIGPGGAFVLGRADDIYQQSADQRSLRMAFSTKDLEASCADTATLPGKTIYRLNKTAELIFPGVVYDANGTVYDLRFQINGVNLITNTTAQKSYSGELFATENGIYVFRQRNGEAIAIDVTMQITTSAGEPAAGTFLFSGYDLDMQNEIAGGGWYSEGFNLLEGYSIETLTTADYNFLISGGGADLFDHEGSIIISNQDQGLAGYAYGGYRITGTRPDSGTELSEFIIRADASGMRFVWTGTQQANTFILSKYQPGRIAIAKQDPEGRAVEGASLAVYQILKRDGKTSLVSEAHPEGELLQSWTSGDAAKTLFFAPGTFVLRELAAPEGYQEAEDIWFRVDDDYNVWLITYDAAGERIEIMAPVSMDVTGPDGSGKSDAEQITIPPVIMIDEPKSVPPEAPEEPGYVLPDTGGKGTKWYTLSGISLVLAALMLWKYCFDASLRSSY